MHAAWAAERAVPVWIVEGQSDDPFYNFDKDMYRIYWKLVHNRAGEYFYNAQCSYHFSKSEDGTFSAVTQNSVVGVNGKTNRAALGGPTRLGWPVRFRRALR
jgi:hypothetical protein